MSFDINDALSKLLELEESCQSMRDYLNSIKNPIFYQDGDFIVQRQTLSNEDMDDKYDYFKGLIQDKVDSMPTPSGV